MNVIFKFLTIAFAVAVLHGFECSTCDAQEKTSPNVVLIAIDDLNDWIEPLGGHPQVETPAMARLAARGVTFTNAHCQAPLCNPSRTSILTARRPSTTGIYGLAPWFRNVDSLARLVTLPQHFKSHGYKTLIGGKIYHAGYGRGKRSEIEADVWGPNAKVGAKPEQKLVGDTPGGNNGLMDWGTFPHRDEDKGDFAIATWAKEEIKELAKTPEQPFFLAAGFFLPHVPCYVTQKWYDMYPVETLISPPMPLDDRNDTPESSWYLHWYLPEPRTSWLRENNQLKNLTRSYLASISFVDSQVGRLLDQLESSGLSENTIVVLFSDHGYHLGEKSISGKNSLWRHSTRVPLIVSVPAGLTDFEVPVATRCKQPVELLDIYATVSQLAGIPTPANQEGLSLVPQLLDVDSVRERPAICTHNVGNHSVCDARWRYIVYADGAEELYDTIADPLEHKNLAVGSRSNEHRAVIDRLSSWLPEKEAPLADGSKHRILEKRGDSFFWEGRKIVPDEKIK